MQKPTSTSCWELHFSYVSRFIVRCYGTSLWSGPIVAALFVPYMKSLAFPTEMVMSVALSTV